MDASTVGGYIGLATGAALAIYTAFRGKHRLHSKCCSRICDIAYELDPPRITPDSSIATPKPSSQQLPWPGRLSYWPCMAARGAQLSVVPFCRIHMGSLGFWHSTDRSSAWHASTAASAHVRACTSAAPQGDIRRRAWRASNRSQCTARQSGDTPARG